MVWKVRAPKIKRIFIVKFCHKETSQTYFFRGGVTQDVEAEHGAKQQQSMQDNREV